MVGKRDEELFGADVARRLSRINRRALAGASVRAEVELDLPIGRSTFDLTVGPLRGPGGQVMGVGGIAYNLTPRTRVGRLDSVAEQSPIAMGILDDDLHFVETNGAFRDFVGYSKEELDAMTFDDVFDSIPDSLVTFPLEGESGATGFVLDVPTRAARLVKPARFARGAKPS
jgi:PAS domain-containing protein